MSKERGPFHKCVKYVEEHKWECNFCGLMSCGNTRRIRAHLAGKSGLGIKVCEKVTDPVRAEALKTFEGQGRGLDKSTEGTSGKGMEGTVFGSSQSVLPSEGASNPNGVQNSNRPGCVPQQPSFYPPTGAGTASAGPQDQGSLPPGDMPVDNLDNTQQRDLLNPRLDAAHGNEIASSFNPLGCTPQQTSFDPPTGTGTAPVCPQDQEPLRSSMPQHLIDLFASPSLDISALLEFPEQSSHDASTPDAPPCSDRSILPNFLPENLHEPVAKFFEGIEADERHNLEEVDGANPSQDCGQPHGVEEVPVPSNGSPTNINQQSGQLPQRCDEEDGSDIRRFPSPTQTEIDPLSAPLQTIVDSVVVEASTDTVVSSSSHELDTNKGAPMTSHPNTRNNFEENRALKRKLELPYSKGAVIRDKLEFAASLSLKKPRMEVVNWLANVEKLRNDSSEATSEDCLPPHEQVDILMREEEGLNRQDKGLFEARETKVRKLLEGKMEGEAFGRNAAKILELLVGNQISRLGIWGMGGVGKTTIMLHVHNRLLKKANYGKVLWVSMSQDFNTRRLQDAIGKEIDSGILQENDVRKRAARLYDCLMEGGISIIILDDVWECFDFNEVGIPDEIKLVLTTRSLEVCRQMCCQKMIKITPLSHGEAETLFLKELQLEVALDLKTKAIMESIVKECAGLPLAVITMARSMRGVTEMFEWEDCLEKLKESDMQQTSMENKVLTKLKFSYNRLRNHKVQQCFLSCALYPEDKLIDKFELIEFFIDQGLIDRLDTREKQYVRGLTILNELANVCLLEDHKRKMKMHDLIRDMALHIMSETSMVKAGKGLRMMPPDEYWTYDLEKVSLMDNEIIVSEVSPLNMSPNCPKLSIFLLNTNSPNYVDFPDYFFKQLRGLTVLNLSGCWLTKLPDSISDLVNLRALLLRNCSYLCHIPCLGKLRYLRKLDMFHCTVLEAISGLEMLESLTCLDIAYTRIKRLPKGTLGALLKLQYLIVQSVNVEDIIMCIGDTRMPV